MEKSHVPLTRTSLPDVVAGVDVAAGDWVHARNSFMKASFFSAIILCCGDLEKETQILDIIAIFSGVKLSILTIPEDVDQNPGDQEALLETSEGGAQANQLDQPWCNLAGASP